MPAPDRIKTYLKGVVTELSDLGSRELYADSVLTKCAVQCVPVRLRVPQDHPLYADLEQTSHTVAHTFPLELLGYNIGSNAGLVTWLRDYFREWIEPARRTCYRSVVMDVNIYWRTMKVHICPCHMMFIFCSIS